MTDIKHNHTTKRRLQWGVWQWHSVERRVERGVECRMLPCFSRRTTRSDFKPAKYADCSNNDDYVCLACMRGSNLLATAEGSRKHWQCQRHEGVASHGSKAIQTTQNHPLSIHSLPYVVQQRQWRVAKAFSRATFQQMRLLVQLDGPTHWLNDWLTDWMTDWLKAKGTKWRPTNAKTLGAYGNTSITKTKSQGKSEKVSL